jgi:hypothetical protein
MILRGADHECGQCHVVFQGLGLFERHQDVKYTRDPVIICKTPSMLGLVQSPRGVWHTPEGLAKALRTKENFARARSAKAS